MTEPHETQDDTENGVKLTQGNQKTSSPSWSVIVSWYECKVGGRMSEG